MSSSARHPSARLWLALRLVDLPLKVLNIAVDDSKPTVVSEKQHVVFANTAARSADVLTGMDVTTATLLSACTVHNRNQTAEQLALAQLAEQLYQFTPHIEILARNEPVQAGLLLELSSCLQLFSGISLLSQKIFKHVEAMSFHVEYGLAHSAPGAWLLSFAHHDITGTEVPAVFYERLCALPIQLLTIYPQAVDGLEKTGFTTLGDIARQIETHSISAIKKRFGVEFAHYLGEIFLLDQDFRQPGLFTTPVSQYQPRDFFYGSLQFDYPIAQLDQLQVPLEKLLQNLTDYLRSRQLECQEIEWTLADIYRNNETLRVYSDHPQSDGALLYELTYIQLEQRQLPFDIDSLALRCEQTKPLQASNHRLDFNRTRRADRRTENFAVTAAKLKARLGDAAIFKLSYCDSHLPEMTNTTVAVNETCNQQLPQLHRVALRPTWLLANPEPIEQRDRGLYWRGHLHLLAGPERIQGNWWREPAARDYFLALRQDHMRLWIFRDLHSQQWFVQGVFG